MDYEKHTIDNDDKTRRAIIYHYAERDETRVFFLKASQPDVANIQLVYGLGALYEMLYNFFGHEINDITTQKVKAK